MLFLSSLIQRLKFSSIFLLFIGWSHVNQYSELFFSLWKIDFFQSVSKSNRKFLRHIVAKNLVIKL